MGYFLKNWIIIIGLLLTGGGLQAQVSHWRSLLGDWHYHRQSYEKAKEYYDQAGSFYNKGNTLFLLGNFEQAAADWVQAANTFRHPADQADAWYNAGNAYYEQGKYFEAVEAYKNSLRKSPNRVDARKNLRMAQLAIPPVSPPPPPPPPPPPVKSKAFIDQANWRKEVVPVTMNAEEARKRLERLIVPIETESAKQYRRLAPSNIPRKGEKAW